MKYLIAVSFWILAIWLIRRDTARRTGISPAVWIPTLWAGILLSRPLTMWLGFGYGTSSQEGSPLDRTFYLGMILLALVTLVRRNVNWSGLVSLNLPIFLFYGYLLVSVFWSDLPVPSFKRWFKDLGNLFVALVILTEREPQQAFRAVFVRCAYVLLPLSVILIRYFPALGRFYTKSGELSVTGVTTQKNSLGALVVVCGLVLIWDWLEKPHRDQPRRQRAENYLLLVIFLIGAHLLFQCDSQTSILCLFIGAGVLVAGQLPILRKRIAAFGVYTTLAVLGLFLLDSVFDLKNAILGSMGRDATFTGRTDVWREVLALNTDPLFGTGYYSLWDSDLYRTRLPTWCVTTAHNGYLEVYLDGGFIGILFLIMMLLAVGWRINCQLATSRNYGLIRFAFLLIVLITNLSESYFARSSPMWFIFLLVALELPRRRSNTIGSDPAKSLPLPAKRVGLSPELVSTVNRV